MKRNRKHRCRAGFTLAEMLLATLILLLVSSIVATGVPVAKNAYEKVVLGANAQVLLSTTVSALRNELGTAYGAIEATGSEVSYFSAATGARARLFVGDAGTGGAKKAIMRQNYAAVSFAGNTDVNGENDAYPLLSEAASTKDLYAVYDDVSYNESSGIVTFAGLKVCRTNGSVLATMGEGKAGDLEIRVSFADRGSEAASGG